MKARGCAKNEFGHSRIGAFAARVSEEGCAKNEFGHSPFVFYTRLPVLLRPAGRHGGVRIRVRRR